MENLPNDDGIYERINTNGFLRPFITGYTESDTCFGWKDHNHSIAVDKFREASKKFEYIISPFMYPDGHDVYNPISYIMRKKDNEYVKVGRIIWKRHPEIYEFMFGKSKR